MYSETCINRSCSKPEILLRRADAFDPVCFLYASLLGISKAETVKRIPLQTDNFFQSSNKKATCLTRTQINILGISEKQRIKLDIFVSFLKKKHFLHFKTTINFNFILQFYKSVTLLSRTLYLFFYLALCKQPAVVLRHCKRHRTQTFKPYSNVLWTIGFSTLTNIKPWWSVKDLEKIALKI